MIYRILYRFSEDFHICISVQSVPKRWLVFESEPNTKSDLRTDFGFLLIVKIYSRKLKSNLSISLGELLEIICCQKIVFT